jgi:hypothetical protein
VTTGRVTEEAEEFDNFENDRGDRRSQKNMPIVSMTEEREDIGKR